jgi:hypothetical protein
MRRPPVRREYQMRSLPAATTMIAVRAPQQLPNSGRRCLVRGSRLPLTGWSMLVSSYISPKASKGGPSAIEGRGLAAVAPIAKDELVAIKGGHIVDTATLRSLPDRLANSDVQIADGFHLVALDEAEYEPVMLFINHSCEPNVGFGGNIVLVAMRDIAAGEELTTDYALFDDYDGEMECRCGRAACRGTIGGRDWRRPELQRRYGSYFSWYLQRRMRPTPDAARGQSFERSISRDFS